MSLKALTLAAGLAGATGLSQFPEFSQQYVQRLGGAVDALGQVVADFDASAAAEGLSRADALAQMVGTGFVARRRADMERTIDRHDRLSRQLDQMQQAGPFMRAYHAAAMDSDIARATWAAYQPALQLTFAGSVFAGGGFVLGALLIGGLGSLIRGTRGHPTVHRA